MEEPLRFPASLVRAQIEAVLRGWGMSERNIAPSADVMVETDLMGVDSHGISMLMLYDVMKQAGQINMTAEPRIVRESATTALVDGGAGLGHPSAVMAMQLAIEKALRHDLGAVSVFNSQHFGAAGYYAQMAAERGLLAMVTSSTRLVTLVPTHGAQAVLGTNPLAFAAPAGREPPVILDIATTVVAANKVKVYALQGKDIPAGWVVDGTGASVTDSEEAFRLLFEKFQGGLAPIGGDGKTLGGHKGYGLAVFAQILSSTLSGGSFSPIRNRTQRPSDPDNIGHFFLAVNPAAFRPVEEFRADMDVLLETLRATKPANSAEPVLVPGDPERQARAERLAKGIPLARSLLDRLRAIAHSAGAEFLLDTQPHGPADGPHSQNSGPRHNERQIMQIGFKINPRPQEQDASALELLRDIPTPILSDNMARMFAVGPGLRPYHRGGAMIGSALTVRTRPGDNLMVHKAIDLAQPGDVIVVDAGGDLTNAIVGEIMTTLAQSRGAAGMVIDGAIRDFDALAASDFPVYARGVTHRGPYKDGPGEINVVIAIGGQAIAPGDIVVGDGDGVLAVQRADARRVAELARAQMDREAAILSAIADRSIDRSWVDETLRAKGLNL